LFALAVKQARITHKDVDQYFIILTKLYENNLLSDSIIIPADVRAGGYEKELLWLAANVNIKFDKLFELLKCPSGANQRAVSPVRCEAPTSFFPRSPALRGREKLWGNAER
jgi:hypothetical protein